MAGIKYHSMPEDPICNQQRKLYLCKGNTDTACWWSGILVLTWKQ